MEANTATTTAAEPAEPVSEPGVAPQADQGNGAAPEAPSDERDETGRYLSREAAGYRRRLRETEAERDQLRERLDRLQTAEVERLAAGAGLAAAQDVWTFGASLDTLRGDDGAINPDAVSDTVTAILRDRPGLKARPVGDIGIGKGNAATPPKGPAIGLSQLLKGQA